jgi:hypothetical protein
LVGAGVVWSQLKLSFLILFSRLLRCGSLVMPLHDVLDMLLQESFGSVRASVTRGEAVNRYLSSGRSQQRLMELHRGISTAVQALNQHHTVLVGAILGCDQSTQKRVLDDHRALIAAAGEAVARLSSFADQCRVGSPLLGSPESSLDGDPTALPAHS